MQDLGKKAKSYAETYEKELGESVIPFWLKYSKDEDFGGYFTCLDRTGKVYDRDKFIWLQARQAWTFSMLYNRRNPREDWLQFANHGIQFLQAHGSDEQGNWYFSLTDQGKPLIQPYNIFSDCFASMAFGQYAQATQQDEFAQIAVSSFHNILSRKSNPKGKYNKSVPDTRPIKNFALPMILSNLSLELEDLLDQETVEANIATCIHEVMEVFYDDQTGLVLEYVNPLGELVDSFEGRLINPGHAIEAMWFMMDLGARIRDKALITQAKDRMLHMLTYGWDAEFGGIFYFMDRKGFPPQQLEWNQKLWWVHLETLVGLAKGFHLTGDPACWEWFEKLHAYAWPKFSDPAYGEWFGYLNRRGEVLLPLKGGKWKGCFHVPRALFQISETLQKIALTRL